MTCKPQKSKLFILGDCIRKDQWALGAQVHPKSKKSLFDQLVEGAFLFRFNLSQFQPGHRPEKRDKIQSKKPPICSYDNPIPGVKQSKTQVHNISARLRSLIIGGARARSGLKRMADKGWESFHRRLP